MPKEAEVQTNDGKCYTLRILPYRTLDNVIEGAVITFVDITEVKRTREALQKANELLRLAVVVRDAHDAITVQDAGRPHHGLEPGRRSACMAGPRPRRWQMNVRERIPRALQSIALAQVQQLSQAKTLAPYHTRRLTKDGRVLDVDLTATALLDEAGKVYAIATTERLAAVQMAQ